MRHPVGSTTGSAMKSIFNSNSGGTSRGVLRHLGPLEQGLLEALWLRGTATVRELLEDGYQDLAYTTVMTTLDRLFKKGLLTRSEEGRAFLYAPRFSREELHPDAAGPPVPHPSDAHPPSPSPPSFLPPFLRP